MPLHSCGALLKTSWGTQYLTASSAKTETRPGRPTHWTCRPQTWSHGSYFTFSTLPERHLPTILLLQRPPWRLDNFLTALVSLKSNHTNNFYTYSQQCVYHCRRLKQNSRLSSLIVARHLSSVYSEKAEGETSQQASPYCLDCCFRSVLTITPTFVCARA